MVIRFVYDAVAYVLIVIAKAKIASLHLRLMFLKRQGANMTADSFTFMVRVTHDTPLFALNVLDE
jgi:hypothetical protein